MVVAKKDEPVEIAWRRIDEWLGKILSSVQAWSDSGDQLRQFLPHHKRPRFHITTCHSGHLVAGDHSLHLGWTKIYFLRLVLSVGHDYHDLRE